MYDLHTHSTASDGQYTPTELVREASKLGITTLSLTDHDTTAGLEEAQVTALEYGIRLIPGVEISVTWENKSIHLVGLNVDVTCAILQDGLHQIRIVRTERAKKMGRHLAEYGMPGIYESVLAYAGENMITRTHFAKRIVELGLAVDMRDVFDRYLTYGKPGYIPTYWADMAEAVYWIRKSGGIPVLAHPQRYLLTGNKLRHLIETFSTVGGRAIEVVCGTHSPSETDSSASYARRFNLLASCGSDFHGHRCEWPKLGRLPPLPKGLIPVWSDWEG